MGTRVSPIVPDPDVESGAVLLPRARRANPLHCGGGCIFLDWAPLSRNAPTDGAGSEEDYFSCRHRPEILFRSGLYVWDGGEYSDDRFPGASLYSSDDCAGIWVIGDLAD